MSPSFLLLSVPVRPGASENDRLSGEPLLCCRWRGFVRRRWPCGVCACVRVHPPEGSARSVRVWGAWPGLVRVQLLLSNHSEDQRPGTWSSWKYSRGMRADRERWKARINTKSRCHFKWLFLGGSVCANADCVCAHVCVDTISGEEKGKEGTELILSVYQKPYLSVIEFSPSSIVVVFVSGDWMVDFSPPLSGSAVLQLQQQIHSKNCLVPL